MSRDIKDLKPVLQTIFLEHQKRCLAIGIYIFLVYTLRTKTEQIALYAQGRTSLSEVNHLRAVAGMPPITLAQNKGIVTKTMLSRHFGTEPDGLAEAYDIAIRNGKGDVFDPKMDSNHNNLTDWDEVARIGKELGLECGRFWKWKDSGHFEMRKGYKYAA
jgi:peptidoglycan L-alanyl-D-glutamate endopeptidase CwlK